MHNRFLSPLSAVILGMSANATVLAQNDLSSPEVDAAVRSLAQNIDDEFFDSDRASQISSDLIMALEAGDFASITEGDQLAASLTAMLSEEDRHFRVNYVGRQAAAEALAQDSARESNNPPPPGDRYAGLRRRNFGYDSVEILPGNIGYIDLRLFSPVEPAVETASAALEFVANTDAVIFDLRQNSGGDPSMVQFLISHFLNPEEPVIINTFVSRDHEYPIQMWSLPSHPAGNRPETPLIVLTSERSASAAEGFSYHLQAMERAILIGETTYGAGNPGGNHIIEEGFSIFISTGSARNPITQTNWEGVGVEPHIAVESERALDTALIRLYAELADAHTDPVQALILTWTGEALAARLNPVILSDEEVARYAGNFGIRSTRVESGQLIYQRAGGQPNTLIPLGDHRFAFPDDDRYRIIFRFDRRDRLTGMDMHLADGREISNPLND